MTNDLFKNVSADLRNVGKTLLAMLLTLSGWANAMPAAEQAPVKLSSLGAHTLLVQTDGEGVSPATTTPVTTQPSGSALLVLVASGNSNPAGPADNYVNTWKQVGSNVIYHGYDGRFNARAYVAMAAKGGHGHIIRVLKAGEPAGEFTLPFIEVRNAGRLQDVAENYPTPSLIGRYIDKMARTWHGSREDHSNVELTSGTVTTTGPATLIAVWWGDAYVYRMTAVPGNGFRTIESFLDLPPNSGIQCAVASRQVATAGTYDVTWKGTPAQGAILWLFAFQL